MRIAQSKNTTLKNYIWFTLQFIRMQPSTLRKQRSLGDASIFHCKICDDIALRPKQCFDCGGLFCESCVNPILREGKNCPEGCYSSSIKEMSAGLKRIYNEIDLKCRHYELCKRTLKITDIIGHQQDCQAPFCKGKENCQNKITKNKKFNESFCSPECYIQDLMKTIKDPKQLFVTLSKLFHLPEQQIDLHWDQNHKPEFAKVMQNRVKAQNAPVYSFVSIVSKEGFRKGQHYWEILDSANQSLIKVGVTTTKFFNCNSAFSDITTGYAYYALGQLRNGSDSKGQTYGLKSSSKSPIGVYLNMETGILGFVINGTYFGPAYKTEELTKGEIFPAVAFLKAIDCTIIKKPIPAIIKSYI